ncbi:MAG: LLM class F420-dependent oxidoreductase [Deltaproteobacteria bacterium]|nr:LLM class F420-dependent oxidoreductase [Deltaproteobacteria bacterium]
MKLGLTLGYGGSSTGLNVPLIQRADELGYAIAWSAEAYGADAVTPLAWIGAQTRRIKLGTGIMQIPGRSPANTAMTAMTLDELSGGRFILGLGVSGPQVVEGWHGIPFGKPLKRTREYIAIVRQVLERKAPVEFSGEYYRIPYAGEDATGLGKPLKSVLHGRADLPIFLAAIGPKNIALAAEIGDGWLPVFFSPDRFGLFETSLNEGFARAGGGKSLANFTISPYVHVEIGPDVQACRDAVKPHMALYVGGMGAKGKNFYNDLMCRYGYEDAAEKVQSLYLAGKKAEAAAALPDALIDEVALCGPRERIAERLSAWRKIPGLVLCTRAPNEDTLNTLAELVL